MTEEKNTEKGKDRKVQEGDKIKVEYEGKFKDGEVFDSSDKGQGKPIEFTVGEKKVIPGMDEAVRGMQVDEEKEFSVGPDKGFGERKEGMRKEIPRDKMPEGQEPKEGMMLALGTPDGRQVPGKVVEIDDEKVVIDLNHPLAGKDLDFKIKIANIE